MTAWLDGNIHCMHDDSNATVWSATLHAYMMTLKTVVGIADDDDDDDDDDVSVSGSRSCH